MNKTASSASGTPSRFSITKSVHMPVFLPAAAIVVTFILVVLIGGEPIAAFFQNMQGKVSSTFGGFYLVSINVALLTTILLFFSPARNIRLGGKDAVADFGFLPWLAMLFSAGMGIGLLFFSVAEPMVQFANPPVAEAGSAQAFSDAMEGTYFLWGIHVWAIYAMIGLPLAYFAFNKGLPFTIRTALYPVLGERIHGLWGHVIDVTAILATIFGLATTLGFGAQQVAAGMEYLFDISPSTETQVAVIVIITAIATGSVVLGLHKGIKNLSVVTIFLSVVLLGIVLVLGPTVFVGETLLSTTGSYLRNFASWSTHARVSTESGEFFRGWSIFYWGWWLSWSPFVGLFIARISRGRTVAEFLACVVLAPTLVTIVWMATFGTSAYKVEMQQAGFAEIVSNSIATGLFQMLDQYPLALTTSLLGLFLVIAYFVTSSDSGSLVVDSIASGGQTDCHVGTRVFWAVLEGAVAATLLLGGGLSAMQAVSLSAGLPFALIILFLCYGTLRTLPKEGRIGR